MNKTFKIHCSQIGKIMGNSKPVGALSQTAKTYLKEWYANDREQIHSKYWDKGNLMESDAIDLMANVLGYGVAEKNEVVFSNEFMIGTPDVILTDLVLDIKCPWNKKTLYDSLEEINSDYEWQLQGYMALTDKTKACLFYALMDTPEDINYGNEIIYSDLPLKERWAGFYIQFDSDMIKRIEEKVVQCREFLKEWDAFVKSKLGKIN